MKQFLKNCPIHLLCTSTSISSESDFQRNKVSLRSQRYTATTKVKELTRKIFVTSLPNDIGISLNFSNDLKLSFCRCLVSLRFMSHLVTHDFELRLLMINAIRIIRLLTFTSLRQKLSMGETY